MGKMILLLRKAGHTGKVPEKKTVVRDGKTYQQTFWVNPAGKNGGSVAHPPLITGVAPIAVNRHNYGELAKREFKKLEKKIKEGLFCPALENRRVAGILKKHLKSTKGKSRGIDEVISRVALMPYIIPIIEKGIAEKRVSEKGNSYRLTGKISENKEVSVILIENKKTKLLYFSVFESTEKMMNKSLAHSGGQHRGGVYWLPASPVGLETYSPGLNFIIPEIAEKSTKKTNTTSDSLKKSIARLKFQIARWELEQALSRLGVER
jgi:hypothetical protein